METVNANKSIPRQLYNNLILYPKGMSQMAKTILAPFTHARNFLSATAFAVTTGVAIAFVYSVLFCVVTAMLMSSLF
jgi:hypothetical protein